MIAVAVGGFYDEIIGVLDVLGVAEDGLVEVSYVTGENYLFFAAVLAEPDFDGGGAQQMSDVGKTHRDGLVELDTAAVFAGTQELQQPLDVVEIVQGLDGRLAPPLSLARFPFRVGYLNVAAVAEHYIQQGAGSGVIISEDGYIITNYHVIEDATQISITLRNEKEYTKVEIVGIYESGDIALLKIKTNDKFTPAVMGDSSKLKVGDYPVAIGNPLAQLGGTVTDGIISALDRKVTIDDETMNLLQTNAEISPGNSGGGLFDGNGELIGIVNAKSSKTSSEGLGFAIPVNDVVDVLSDLKEYGYVKGQIDLGMSLSDVTSTAQAWMYGANKTGVYVTSVDIGSNAEKAGFQSGDIIQQVNGTKVTSTKEVNDIIKTLKVGDSVSFKVYRNGSTGVLKMKLAEYKPSTFKSSNTQEERNDQNSFWNFFNY